MRVTCYYGKKLIHILIHYGSTHNFLDQGLAQKLGCKLEPVHPHAVANGNQLSCSLVCKGFTWQLPFAKFTTYALMTPLGGSDIVLEVQWLNTSGTVK